MVTNTNACDLLSLEFEIDIDHEHEDKAEQQH